MRIWAIFVDDHFNPRSREGSDEGAKCLDQKNRAISIHAPARGATMSAKSTSLCHVEFQSTLPRGERLEASNMQGHTKAFQSTLPRGERPYNPLNSNGLKLFQSTLPRGERLTPFVFVDHIISNFNPRSREGSDFLPVGLRQTVINFNPRSREGSDSVNSPSSPPHEYFNPRSREGSDACIVSNPCDLKR